MHSLFKSPVPLPPPGSGRPPLLRTGSVESVTSETESTVGLNGARLPSPHFGAPSPHSKLARASSLSSLTSSLSVSASPSSSPPQEWLGDASLRGSMGGVASSPFSVIPEDSLSGGLGMMRGGGGGSVHVLWDVVHVPFPSSLPPSFTIERVQRMAEAYGTLVSIKALCFSSEYGERGHGRDGLPLHLKRSLHEHGVEVEEVFRGERSAAAASHSLDLALLANVLRIGMGETEQQMQRSKMEGGAARSTLLLLANQDDFGRALHVLRRSGRFDVVVVYHLAPTNALLPSHEPVGLLRHASASFEWSAVLRQALAPNAVISFESLRGQRDHPPHSRSSYKDLTALGHHHAPSGELSYNSSALNSRASTPTSTRSSTFGAGFSGQATPSFSRASSLSSRQSVDLTPQANTGGRAQMGALLSVPSTLDSNTTNLAELTLELQLERMSPQLRAMLMAFKSVLSYCEEERIIPRSVHTFE